MIIFITIYPANTLLEPLVIAPPSQESPIRAIALPLTKTVLDPALITAECGTQTGGDAEFGIVCAAVGSALRSTPLVLQKTSVDGPDYCCCSITSVTCSCSITISSYAWHYFFLAFVFFFAAGFLVAGAGSLIGLPTDSTTGSTIFLTGAIDAVFNSSGITTAPSQTNLSLFAKC